jgi:hypothetical protein
LADIPLTLRTIEEIRSEPLTDAPWVATFIADLDG